MTFFGQTVGELERDSALGALILFGLFAKYIAATQNGLLYNGRLNDIRLMTGLSRTVRSSQRPIYPLKSRPSATDDDTHCARVICNKKRRDRGCYPPLTSPSLGGLVPIEIIGRDIIYYDPSAWT